MGVKDDYKPVTGYFDAERLESENKYHFRPEFLSVLFSYLKIMPGISVADVGCGTGFLARLIATRMKGKGKVVGIDVDEELLKVGEEKAREEELSGIVEFKLGDAYNIPFPDNHFDVVISSHLLCVLKDPMKSIVEMRRVAKSGGSVSAIACYQAEGLKGFPGDYDFPEFKRLQKLMEKFEKIRHEKIFFPTFGISPETQYLQFPLLFRKAGLRNIEMNGHLYLFSISDFRYTLDEMRGYILRNYKNTVKTIEKYKHDRLAELLEGGMSADEMEETLKLLRKKRDYLLEDTNRIRGVMEIIAEPEIIITGTK